MKFCEIDVQREMQIIRPYLPGKNDQKKAKKIKKLTPEERGYILAVLKGYQNNQPKVAFTGKVETGKMYQFLGGTSSFRYMRAWQSLKNKIKNILRIGVTANTVIQEWNQILKYEQKTKSERVRNYVESVKKYLDENHLKLVISEEDFKKLKEPSTVEEAKKWAEKIVGFLPPDAHGASGKILAGASSMSTDESHV